jgi:predicted lysophospholipase L1 biosynthesis ABC-type transport system permease subunit
MKNGNMDLMPSYLYLRFKYSGIQTIIIIVGGIYVLNQYYRILKTNLKDYSIIKGLGASRNQICFLIFFQAFLLFTITVPFGIFAGISASQYLLVILSDFVFRNLSYHFIDTSIEISFITGMISCALLAFGVILEEGIRRKLPAQIDSE